MTVKTAPESLAGETAKGAMWLAAAGACTQVLVFVSNVFVARCLMPEDYGTAAAAMVVISFATVFVSFGFAPAIVSGRLRGPAAVSTSHWLICLGGLMLGGAIFAVGPVVAGFFCNEKVGPATSVASLILVVSAWEVVPQAVLLSSGRFNVVASATVIAQVAMSGAAIAMAYAGAGMWALIVPPILGTAARSVGFMIAVPGCLRPRLALGELRPFMGEGARLTGNQISEYVFINSDKIVVGRMFGSEQLGVYNFAYSLVSRSLFIFSRTLSSPLLSSLGRLRDDITRFDRAVVRACLAIARFTFPLSVGGALLAPELIHTLFGAQWSGAVMLVRIYFLLGALHSVSHISGAVWLALGCSRLVLYWGLTTNTLTLGVYIAGAMLGSVEAVAIVFAAYGAFILTPLGIWATRKWCGIPLAGLGVGMLHVVRDTLCMAMVVVCVDWLLDGYITIKWIRLMVTVFAGAITYTAMFRAGSAGEMASLFSVLPSQLRAAASHLFLLPLTAGRAAER